MNEEEKLPKRQLILVGIAVLLTGILLIVKPSHSVFQVNKTINIMDAKVGDFKGCDKLTVIAGDINIDYCDNMISVAFDSSGQTVRADETNTDSTYYWFDYCQNKDSGAYNYKASGCTFRWANIILVTDTNRNTYKNSTPGTLINESDILAYFVYVPRYRYQLFNANNGTASPQIINIEFESKTTTPSCGGNTCTTNRIYSTGINDEWLTHPAFTFGESELNGIWVGKFETSADETSTCYSLPSTSTCDDTAGTVITPRIKPNKHSWNYVVIPTAYTVSRYFETKSLYGIKSSTIDSHVMKNMEWGAVAYLYHSIYGKRGNQAQAIYINNYNEGAPYYNTLTGCSALGASASSATSCTYPFPNTIGEGASTSGTLYGIYDMSGGALEIVMGYMVANGETPPAVINLSTTGTFIPFPDFKYYDSYAYGTTSNDATAFARGYLGDATKEITMNLSCPINSGCFWFGHASNMLLSPYKFFARGGAFSGAGAAGIFASNPDGGGGGLFGGFRVTLVVE